MAKIKAPSETFNGEVGGVQFENGASETDNQAVLSYCVGAGYTVEFDELPEPEPVPELEEPAAKPRRNTK